MCINSSVIAGRVVVEISYAVPPQLGSEEAEPNPLIEGRAEGRAGAAGRGMGLAVCQGIGQGHGGEVRFFSWLGAARFEGGLPVEDSHGGSVRAESRNTVARPPTLVALDPETES